MKKLSLEEMEKVNGEGCGRSAVLLALNYAGAALVTGPIGAALFMATFVLSSIDVAEACS